MHGLALTILGTAAARPWPGSPTTAAFVNSENCQVLLDCGEGTLLQLPSNAFGDRGLDAVAITHLHGDHVYGLPGLLTSMSLAGRKRVLELVGPTNLEAYLSDVLRWSAAHVDFELRFTRVTEGSPEEGVLVSVKGLTLRSLPLLHRVEAYGYVLETVSRGRRIRPGVIEALKIPFSEIPGLRAGADWRTPAGRLLSNAELTLDPWPQRSIAYLTDTAPLPGWPQGWPAPDVLIHEATFSQEHAELARRTGHSTVSGAAAFAKTCGAKKLLLIHRSVRYANPEALLVEGTAIFPQMRWAVPGECLQL